MAQHASTLGRAHIGFASPAEIDVFADTLARFERGEIDSDAWRAFRLVHGTYGQRQDADASMLRAKIPQGILSAAQLEAVADVAERYSRGFAHVTTRQNFQFHFMKLADVTPAMSRLAEAGITTREACGNSVRNITTSATAGVASDEVFDPTPYAIALTNYLLRHPLSSSLPRKFKIAFTGGGADHSFALINDLGWHARVETQADGRTVRGFRLTVGGGTALWCQSGRELFAFLPAEEMFAVSLAILRVFHARGDRVHRHKNRIRYLIKSLGWDTWEKLVRAELTRIAEEGAPRLPFEPDAPPEDPGALPPSEPPPLSETRARDEEILRQLVDRDVVRGPGLAPRFLPVLGDEERSRWEKTNVRPQRQPGYSLVTITVPLGDLTSGRLRAVGHIASVHGDGSVRTTAGQNLVLRWVRNERVGAVYSALKLIGLAASDPESVTDVTSCPGAESCKLAVTQSRGLAQDIGDAFKGEGGSLVDRAAGLVVKVSGCPNGCGLHHVAGLGFQGGLRKVDGRAAPYYHVYAGGDPGGQTAKFGRVIGKLPARRVSQGVRRLVELYEARKNPGEAITAYFGRAAVTELHSAIADLETLDPATASPEDFIDLAETGPFRPETTEGECAA